jgi:hypothetical protein
MLLPNQRLKLSARGRHALSDCPVEALYLVCGARRPQLKRDPLGSSTQMDPLIENPSLLHIFFREPSRPRHLALGFFLVIVGALGVYAGLRGLIAYYDGSRAAPADPIACTIGIVGGGWALWIGLRLCTGRAVGRPLLSPPLLLITSVGCLAAAVWWWHLFGQTSEPLLRRVEAFGAPAGIGILGLVLLWRRVRARDDRK